MQTYRQLQQELNLEHELPVTPDWSAAADFLFLIKNHCLEEKPEIIVECSSGLTSLILSRCCQINNRGHVYSLENGQEYQQQTIENLSQFELEKYIDVFYAPLINLTINQADYKWYHSESVEKLKINMLVIDGPPGFIQKHSRYPALPVLFDQLTDGACVFLDDAVRDDEKELVDMWLKEHPGLSHEFIETQRGCSVIKVKK